MGLFEKTNPPGSEPFSKTKFCVKKEKSLRRKSIKKSLKMAPVVESEVTKHSVHTLVFRSQKRSHEMFIHDQGNLPDSEKDIEAMIKKIKSKSYSEALVQFVDREQARKQAMESRIEVSNPESAENPSGITPGGGGAGAISMTDNPANLNSAQANQLV